MRLNTPKVISPVSEEAKSSVQKRLLLLFLAALIFWAGMMTGQGRLRLQFGSYSNLNADLPANLDYSSVNEVYNVLKQNYNGKLTETELLNGLKAGLANAPGDPYTEYFTATEAKSFDNQLNQSFSGIGAELGKDKNGNLIVVAPITGLPADKAGLKAQDIITAVNGRSTTGLSIDDAVARIRGKAGTTVKLSLVRDNSQQLDLSITRQNIQVPSVEHSVINGNLGYIKVTTFADDTSGSIIKAANDLKAQNVKGIILDLRNDPGGLLSAAVTVSSQWLPDGTTLLQEKRGSTVVQTYQASGQSPLKGLPTVVLINEGSASASEITAGALHDNKAATIIGTKSFGKGVVQQLINLKDGSELKVTIASWYRPNGKNINKKGITPDQMVQPGKDDSPTGNDAQKAAAIDYLQKQ
jgi:carboxyl-terminal processing protease